MSESSDVVWSDLVLYGSSAPVRPSRHVRRGSSVVKMLSEELHDDEPTSRRSSRSDHDDRRSNSMRRGSSVVKMLSEDLDEGQMSRRSSKSGSRRSSSIIKMLSEEDEPKSTESSEKYRRSIDNTYKHSLESISEYRMQTFSSVSLYPSMDYSSIESPPSDTTSDYAIHTNADGGSKDSTDRTNENDSRTGEWNYFWKNYNSSLNEYFSSPYLCPSNSGEDLSYDSNCSTPKDKSASEKVFLTYEEASEALRCTQRLSEILKDAMKRNGGDDMFHQNSSSKEKSEEKSNSIKSAGSNSCINALLNHTGVADMLKRVLNKRREIIMPSDDSTSRSSFSEWSSSEKK